MCFDLDGVLIDSEHAWDAARRAVVAENGGHWRASATRAMMGMSAPEWSRYLHHELGVPLAPSEINDLVVTRLLAGYGRELPLLPGAVDAVERLAACRPLREFPPDAGALALAAVRLEMLEELTRAVLEAHALGEPRPKHYDRGP